MTWIDINKQLPIDPDTVKTYETIEVIVVSKAGEVFATDFQCGSDWWKFDKRVDPRFDIITHWMPLPDPPDYNKLMVLNQEEKS